MEKQCCNCEHYLCHRQIVNDPNSGVLVSCPNSKSNKCSISNKTVQFSDMNCTEGSFKCWSKLENAIEEIRLTNKTQTVKETEPVHKVEKPIENINVQYDEAKQIIINNKRSFFHSLILTFVMVIGAALGGALAGSFQRAIENAEKNPDSVRIEDLEAFKSGRTVSLACLGIALGVLVLTWVMYFVKKHRKNNN